MAHWIFRITLLGFALAALAACGGGSADGGNGGGSAYSIGGTVTGLTGSGLVLHNGAEDLAVSAAGTFIFSTELASGTPYAVTVKSQPSAPAQSCMVTNGSGTVGTANIADVSVACHDATGYTVSGTVTGLTGSGLVLKNNGGDDLLVTAAGAFTFTTALANGAAYAVTVNTQPSSPPQNCVVTNGSGTVGTANITNVSVACTAPTSYTVGGTITGLTGSGLVLQNNGGDDLFVNATGAFTFTTGLAAGVSYAVTVSAQSSAPPQQCVVTNGSGTVGTANITNVTVACTASKGYTVGGTVTGLTGSGLVIDVYASAPNPVGSVALSAAGAFTFPVEFAQGATYFVVAAAQPNSPRQICNVNNPSGLIGTANVTDVAVVCSTPGRFAYAANAGDNTISSYSIDPTTGALTALGTPVATGTSPYAITGSPDRKHLYVVNQVSNDISVYAVDNSTGVPTPIAGSPFAAGTDPQALAFTPSGEYLYVANHGSDNLSAYAVDMRSGALTPLPTPTYSTGPGPSAVVVTPTGKFVYVANHGGSNDISAFVIAAGTGELAIVAGSPFAVGGNPHGLAFAQGALFTANSGPTMSSISGMEANEQSGQLTQRLGSPFRQSVKNHIANIATDGSNLFVATGVGVSEYFIPALRYALGTSVSAASGANVYSVTVDPASPFFYACNDGTDNVSGYSVGFDSLIPMPGSPFAAGHHPDFLAIL